jgi:hypothetical protein
MERRAPSSKFLIARGDQRRSEAREFGMTRAVLGKELFNRRAVGQLDRVLGVPNDFFETAEE